VVENLKKEKEAAVKRQEFEKAARSGTKNKKTQEAERNS
jgi:hypothetical protein